MYPFYQALRDKITSSETAVNPQPSTEIEIAPAIMPATSSEVPSSDSTSMGLKRKRSVEAEAPNTKNNRRRQRRTNDSVSGYSAQFIQDLPPATRLIIRGIPPDRIPRDLLADRFGRYGEVLEIVPKENYTFIQYPDVESCANAVECEQGRRLDGWQFVLQVCRHKPNTRDAYNATREKDMRSRIGHRRRDEEDSPLDDSTRSVRVTHRRRADSGNNRSSDRKTRRTSRSPSSSSSSSGRRSHARDRSESPDDYQDAVPPTHKQVIPLPHRYGEVPTVQTIASDNADHGFVRHVENAFRNRGVLIQTLFIQPDRISRESMIKKMIVEGVKAVVIVEQGYETLGTVQLQVFDRSTEAEAPNVRYDEYEGVTPENAVLIVQRTLQSPMRNSLPPHSIAVANPGMPPQIAYYGQSVPQGQPLPHNKPLPQGLSLSSLGPNAYSAIPTPIAQQIPLSPHQSLPSVYLPPAPPRSAVSAALPGRNTSTASSSIDVSALANIQTSIQTLIDKQTAAQQQAVNVLDINATIASLQQQLATLASVMNSQQQQQPHTSISKPNQVMQQLSTQLDALTSGGSTPAATLPMTGYSPHHLSSAPQYVVRPVEPSLPHAETDPLPTTSYRAPMIPSANELLGKIKMLSQQVATTPSTSSSPSARKKSRRSNRKNN